MDISAPQTNPWILGSFPKDLIGLFLPGYFGLLCVYLFSEISTLAAIIGFVSLVLIDSGHVYTTFLRGPFFKINNLLKTSASLVLVFLFLFLWLYFQVPYFWSFVVYFTLFHHVRQFVGLIKWYNKLDHYRDTILIYFFYASVLTSVLLFHTSPAEIKTYFMLPGDILYFPSKQVFKSLLIMQVFIWASYIFYAGYLFLVLKLTPYKTHLFFIFSILFYFLVCMSNRNTPLVLVPLLFAHGIPYILLIYTSQKKLKPAVSKNQILLVLIAVVVLMSLAEFGLEENFIDFEYLNTLILPKLALAMFLTPLIFHYVIDGYIWQSKHFLAKKIYS